MPALNNVFKCWASLPTVMQLLLVVPSKYESRYTNRNFMKLYEKTSSTDLNEETRKLTIFIYMDL